MTKFFLLCVFLVLKHWEDMQISCGVFWSCFDILNHGNCVALLCCKSHTHAANIMFQPNICSSCFKQYFPFLLGGENIHNYFIKSIASSHYFIKSIASSRCVEDTLGDTLVHTLVHDKYSPACWVSQNLWRKSKTIPCFPTDCFKSSCLLFIDTMS